MENKKELPTIVKLLIFTLVTGIFWAFFTIYRSFTSEPSPVVPAEILFPLTPKLDEKTIDEIKQRNFLETIPEISINVSESIIKPTPEATEEAEIEVSPEEGDQ